MLEDLSVECVNQMLEEFGEESAQCRCSNYPDCSLDAEFWPPHFDG